MTVLDFGLAVAPEVGGVGQTLLDESVSGTPAYMAPEQAAGRTTTQASDFYAAGVMLFEALTGRLPFEGRAGEMQAAKQHDDAPRARALAPEIPVDLDDLCAQLLARDPAARPGGAALAQWANSRDGAASGARAPDGAGGPADRPSDAAPEVLLGRDEELARMRDAFAATGAGQPVVLFVSGESGMGKTALVEAFLAEVRAQAGAVVLASRCYERENVPYKGFDGVIDEISRLLRRLPAKDATALVPRDVYALARLFPVLDRVPVVAEAPRKHVLDPQELQRRAFSAFGELIGRLRDRQPLVLFIDDLQWTDPDAVRFMRHLLLHPEPVPALLVAAHRSEGAEGNALLQSVIEAAGDNRALSLRRLDIGPLDESALAAVVHRLVDPRRAQTDIDRVVAREAHGSPFFAGELARAMRHQRTGTPLSLREALDAHVATLPAEARRVLGVLAFAGEPLAPAVAVAAAGLADGHAQLDRLVGERLARVQTAGDGARTVECYHDKVRELVAAALDPAIARELASGLARALLAHPGAAPELLARCLEAAGFPEQAVEHAIEAGERAAQALAFDRAAHLYERALALGHFEGDALQALHVKRADALARAGRGIAAAEAYLEARQAAPEAARAHLARMAGEQFLMCGRMEQGRALLREGLKPLGIALPRSMTSASAALLWGRARLRMRGEFVARERHDPHVVEELEALESAMRCLVRTDQLRALVLHTRWVLLAARAGHAVQLGRALSWEPLARAVIRGTIAEVERAAAEASELQARTNDPLIAIWLPYNLGAYEVMRDLAWDCRSDVALAAIDLALERSTRYPHVTTAHDDPWFHWYRAIALICSGRLAEAHRLARGQLELARARGDLVIVGPMLVVESWCAMTEDQVQQGARGVAHYRSAWQSDEPTLQDTQTLAAAMSLAIRQGRARAGWDECQPVLLRITESIYTRTAFLALLRRFLAGWALEAAADTTGEGERRDLQKAAVRWARQVRGASPGAMAQARAVAACAVGDRDGAVAALRALIALPRATPLFMQAARRCLGVLVGGDEGHALIGEADAYFHAAGVSDIERYVAALQPGVAIR